MKERKAPTTRIMLLTVLLLVVAALTGTSLLMVWHRMRQQVTADFTRGLRASALAFRHADTDRLATLQREANLLADLPSLKALMTTDHDRTIEDGAVEFWKIADNDLFALVGRDLRVRAVDTRSPRRGSAMHHDLSAALETSGHEYVLSEGRLYRFAVAPIYFGNADSGTLLGYVVNGSAIDPAYLNRISEQADAVGLLVSGNALLAGAIEGQDASTARSLASVALAQPTPVSLGGERYLAISQQLSSPPDLPLRLVFLKPFRGPDREIHDTSRLLLLIGICIVLLGSVLMLLVARRLTAPLEELTRTVRAFGADEPPDPPRHEGTREVRQLAADFEAMRERIRQSNRTRLENERLATIGSMASSVSHDLRHYLASIYANAEFLAASDTTEPERTEFLEEIRIAVMGTTEMLESLMIFGRTGESVRHAPERIDVLLRHAVAQVRTHPDAAGVTISVFVHQGQTEVTANGKQLERAIYNLLLNACQAARLGTPQGFVDAEVVQLPDAVAVRVTDNGPGIASNMEIMIFDPFVSHGKHNGTGLSLTLCRCIAEEHGGAVQLSGSTPGKTIFQLSLPHIGATAALGANTQRKASS